MADKLKPVDYTTKDYEAYRQDMIDEIPNKLSEWTDHSDSDPGIVILELLANQLEKNSYYNDRVANESFLPTATKRQSVMKHLKLIDYELDWHTPARHWQVIEIEPQTTDTVIPKGTQIGTDGTDEAEDSVVFETLTDLIIPAGATGLEQDGNGEYLYKVEIEHGQTIEDEPIGEILTDTPSPSFKLAYSPVYQPSIEVYVDDYNGRYLWSAVNDFIDSTQDSTHYVAEMNEFEEVIILFGNGVSGKVPSNPSTITATYKAGGGKIGNVGAMTITEIYDSIPGFLQTFNPYGAHVLGTDMEDSEEAKVNGPASLRILNRYVAPPDYEAGIKLDYPAVAKAKAIIVNGNIDLYLAPIEGTVLSSTQKAEITAIIEEKKVIFQGYTLKDPVYKPVNVSVNVIPYDNYDTESIRYSVTNTIQELFSTENMDFGTDVTIADLFYAIRGVEGVRNASITAPTSDVSMADMEIGTLGTLTVTVNGI
jgi:uncharacterized phage protein gp47/JayE